MKISPAGGGLGAVATPATQAPAPDIHRIKMTTKVTPESILFPPPEPEVNVTSDPNGTANADEVAKPLSPQEVAIAKQRRALQIKAKELAEKEKALTAVPKAPDIKAKLKADPLGTLLDAGVTFDELTAAVYAHNGISPEIRELKAEVNALKEGVDKKLSDRVTQEEQQVLGEMRREATKLVSEGDTYELVRVTGSIPQVMELIELTYRKHGEVLDVQEALQLIEDELIKENLRLAQTKKVQSRLAPTLAPQQQQQRSRTLTNRDTASSVMSRKARAMAAFYGTLKK